jgi:2-polyprenyl-3-methyl-5-hydroxy-6-metoxy-1,4-benzoquinol methylase
MIKLPKWLADLGLWVNRLYYKQMFTSVYASGKQPPSWFDHRIDLYYQWPHNLFWLERGVFPRKHMFEGCTVLDLFSGDGFYSRYFYSTIAGRIDALDKDPKAVGHARRWHSNPTINYLIADAVTDDFPKSRYDVIVWFEAIEHLSEVDYRAVINRIKAAMGDHGVMIGSTPIILRENRGKGNWEHQNEFTNVEDLRKFLARDFDEVQIEITVHTELSGGRRQTAYFTVKRPSGGK